MWQQKAGEGRLWRSSSGRSSPGRRPNPVRSGGLKPRRRGEKTKVKCWTTFLLTGDLLISRCWKERFCFLSVPHSSTSVSPPSSPWMFSAINVFIFFSRLVVSLPELGQTCGLCFWASTRTVKICVPIKQWFIQMFDFAVFVKFLILLWQHLKQDHNFFRKLSLCQLFYYYYTWGLCNFIKTT